MITMYCEGERVTDKTFMTVYDVKERDLQERQEKYLKLGFFIQDNYRFYLKDSTYNKNIKKNKKNDNTRVELEISKPELLIYKNLGRKKYIFSDIKTVKLNKSKKYRMVIKHNGVEYTLDEFCFSVGMSEYTFKQNVRGVLSCKLNGAYIEIIRKIRNTTFFDIENINTGETLKNMTLRETRDKLNCCMKKVSSVNKNNGKATIKGYRVVRHSGDNL